MDSPKYSKTDPAVLLLNEIEILLAQTRLMELCLKQAQAAADDQMARAQEQYQVELAALRAALIAEEQARESARAAKPDLLERIQSLEDRLDEERRAVDLRDAELRNSKADGGFLRNRIGQLETAHEQARAVANQAATARQTLENELATVRRDLEANQAHFAQYQVDAREREQGLQAQIGQTQDQLRHRESQSNNLTRELDQASKEVAALRDRVSALQTGRQESEERAARELAQARARFDAELAELRSRLEERDQALLDKQSALIGIERELRDEISTIGNRLQEQRGLVGLRDQELGDARTRIGALEQRVVELDAANRSADVNAGELDRMCRSRDSEIAALQQQVTAKERALTERQEAVTAVELALHNKIQSLQQDLARHRGELEERDRRISSARANADALRRQVTDLESAVASTEAAQATTEIKRRDLESEIAGLRAMLQEQESASTRQQSALSSTVEELRCEIDHERVQAAALRQRTAELESAVAAAELRAQETTETPRRDLEDEVARLHAALQEQAFTSTQRQSEFNSACDKLNTELDRERQETGALRRRIAELASAAQAAGQTQELVETTRRELESEITTLRAALDEKESISAQQQTDFKTSLDRLTNETDQQRVEAERRRRIAEESDAELENLRAARAASEAEKIKSEQARRQLEEHWQHAANACRDLEARLEAKDSEIHAIRSHAEEDKRSVVDEQEKTFKILEERLNGEIAQLRGHLDGRQKTFEQADRELAGLRAAIAAREQENTQTEQSRRELEENWRQSAALCRELDTRVQTKEEELRAAQASIQEVKRQLDAKANEWQLQLAEKQLDVENRGTEITMLKADLIRLSEQLAQREASENQTKAEFRRLTESTRATHQSDLRALEEAHHAKQKAWENDLAQERQTLAELNRRISETEDQHRDVDTRLKDRENELAAAAAETETWRARFEELETLRQNERAVKDEADQVRSNLDTELGALRYELEQKAWASAQQQAALENLALAHKNQIQKFEAKIDEQQRGIKGRELELESVRSHAQSLERRIAELQSELKQADLAARNRSHQLAEEFSTKIDDMNRQLTQTAAEMEERGESQTNRELVLREEVDKLNREAGEKNRILRDRNDELVQVKAEMDQLQERLGQMESSAAETETALTGDAERMRTEFQAQLALLQAELSQKEWVLEERQAAARGLEQKYGQEIETLRRQLTENEKVTKQDNRDFILGEPRLNRGREEHFELAENGAPGNGLSHPSHRRWNSGFGWKRRWRS